MTREQLRNYIKGACSAEEKQLVEEFLLHTENPEELLDPIFNELWDENANYSNKELFPGVLFNEIRSKTTEKYAVTPQRKSGYKKLSALLKYAAILIVAGALSVLLYNNISTKPVQMASIEMVRKSTSNGQKSTILLSDGSKVILNSGSSLSYRKGFTDSARILQLTGEAYFEVARDVTRPFSVIAAGIRTTALGTSFNINSKNDHVKVSLATGKVVVNEEVKFNGEQEMHFLVPGESIQYNRQTKDVKKGKFSIHKDFYWKDGILYFEDAEFSEITETLSTWYDVEFTIKNNHRVSKRYTGKFDNSTLKNVLENMGLALGFDYFLNGKKVKIIFDQTQ